MCPMDILPCETRDSRGVKIEAVYAYNSNHNRDESCGFVLTYMDLLMYHSGDTSMIDETKELKDIDYALFAMDGYWNMVLKKL